jgi:hypothetical protein
MCQVATVSFVKEIHNFEGKFLGENEFHMSRHVEICDISTCHIKWLAVEMSTRY